MIKKFSSSQLSRRPAEVFEAARKGGTTIQLKRTNGELIEEFALIKMGDFVEMVNLHIAFENKYNKLINGAL